MNNEYFILKYYFENYKEYPVASRDSFRNYFIHKHGLYKGLDLLIRLIEEYQMRVYKCTLQGYVDHTKEKRKGGR